MDAKLYFGRVHIVEWLRPGDRGTGAEPLDELEPLGIVSQPPVLAQLHRVATRADFLGVLRGIEGGFRATARHGQPASRWVLSAVRWGFPSLLLNLRPTHRDPDLAEATIAGHPPGIICGR